MNKPLSTLALVGVTALPVGAFAGTASAHDELTGTTPASGSTVTGAPATVGLTFAEKPLTVGNQISVKGPDGSTTTATPTVDGTHVSAPLANHGNGAYTVTWRVVSDDGHPVSGTYTFTVKGAAASSASSSATPSSAASRSASTPSSTSTSTFAPSSPSPASKAHSNDDGGTAWGVIGGVAALAVVVMAAVALASRRRRS